MAGKNRKIKPFTQKGGHYNDKELQNKQQQYNNKRYGYPSFYL